MRSTNASSVQTRPAFSASRRAQKASAGAPCGHCSTSNIVPTRTLLLVTDVATSPYHSPMITTVSPKSPSMTVRTSGTGLRHDGLTVFSPVAAISLPHSQIGTSQLRNAVFLSPTFYPIPLLGRQIPIFVYYNTIRVMSEGHVGSSDEQ